MKAPDSRARQAHLDMARRYDELAGAIGSPELVPSFERVLNR